MHTPLHPKHHPIFLPSTIYLQVGLGTDIAGGYCPSMLSAARSCVIASRCLEDGTQNYRHNHHLDEAPPPEAEERGKEGAGPEARIDWKEALFMATMGGAKALGIEGQVGSFAVGKAFDALLVDVRGGGGGAGAVVCMEGVDGPEDVVQKWVNNGDDRHVREVFVQGKEVKHGRRLREEADGEGEQEA